LVQIKAVIFDWGGVLADEPLQGLIQYCAATLGVDLKKCGSVIEAHLPAFGRGTFSEEGFWQHVCGELACLEPESKSLWSEAFGVVCRPRKTMYDLAETLQKKYKIAVLSNTEAPAVKHFLSYRPELFDVKVFSCDEGVAKPQARLYEICLERLGVEPQEALFIDDREENVAGARAIGLQAVVCKNYQLLVRELESLRFNMGVVRNPGWD